MDGTLLLDGKHRSVHHKKCFCPVTQPFWKKLEDVINIVERRSQLQKKSFFWKYQKQILYVFKTKQIKNRSLLSSCSESDESTDSESESADNESGRLFETPLIGSWTAILNKLTLNKLLYQIKSNHYQINLNKHSKTWLKKQ